MRKVIPNTEFVRIMFVGRSGSTKTRTAYSACLDPRMRRVLGLDMKGQPRSIRTYRPQPDIVGIESLPDLSRIYAWLKNGQKPNDAIVKEAGLNPPYQTVVVDGWSEAQRLVVISASGNTMTQMGDKPKPIEIQHYGTIFAQTTAIFEGFYALPMHVIGTALENEKEDEKNGTVFRIQLVGQSKDQAASYPEIVGRMVHIEKVSNQIKTALKGDKDSGYTEDTISICFFKPSAKHEAKDQTGALGDVMVDATMTKILDLIETSMEEERQETDAKLIH